MRMPSKKTVDQLREETSRPELWEQVEGFTSLIRPKAIRLTPTLAKRLTKLASIHGAENAEKLAKRWLVERIDNELALKDIDNNPPFGFILQGESYRSESISLFLLNNSKHLIALTDERLDRLLSAAVIFNRDHDVDVSGETGLGPSRNSQASHQCPAQPEHVHRLCQIGQSGSEAVHQA